MSDDLEPTLGNLLEADTLQWIFVGGKGGVGKTTTSCSLAVKFADTPIKDKESGSQRQRRVLLVSTDPAHNVSDAFNQKFSRDPSPVNDVPGLDAMEIDPQGVKLLTNNIFNKFNADSTTDQGLAGAVSAIKDALTGLPGIDEVSVLVHIMNEVKRLNYDITIFDTAPTGHTLRLLSLPQTLNETIEKLTSVQGIGGILAQAGTFVSSHTGMTTDEVKGTMQTFTATLKKVQEQFQNNKLTTFVPVCIPEFLPVYETERLMQELCKYKIDVQNIVVNQVIQTIPA
eukprot:gene16076-24616_t